MPSPHGQPSTAAGSETAEERLHDVARSIRPDLAAYLTAVTTRSPFPPGIDLRRRSAMRIGALACQGGTGDVLDNEIAAALDNGVSPSQIVEVMIHTIPYIGIPRPLNSILASKEIFAARSLLPVELAEPGWSHAERLSVGFQRINEAHPSASSLLEENLAPIAASLYQYIVAAAFGDIYGRPGLSYPQRQPITIVTLAAQGNVLNHLRTHVIGALNIGMSPATIAGAQIDTLGIVDTETILRALEVTSEVFAEQGADLAAEDRHW